MDPQATGKLRLLVADDDANLRDALGEYFAREGFAVQLAASGLEAIEFLRRRPFDVSVLDGHMPGLSGPQVLSRLLADPGPQAIPPTVLVSSDASIGTWVREQIGRSGRPGQSGTLAAGLPAGCVDFVPKPIRLDALRRSIQLLLSRQPPCAPAG